MIGEKANSNSAWHVAELVLNNNHPLTHTQGHRLVAFQITTSVSRKINILHTKLTNKNERYLH